MPPVKRKTQHPGHPEKPTIWRSLRERENDPEFEELLSEEFPGGAASPGANGLTKRDFLKLMGASMALAGAGLSGCRRPPSSLVPFSKGVEWAVPGKFLYYATAMPCRQGAVPLVATTVDGRPTKLEGNPLHPSSNGGTNCFAQAAILELYDPHRSKQITEHGRPCEDGMFEGFLKKLGDNPASGLAVLAESKHSPTRDRLRMELQSNFPDLLWCEYDPVGDSEAALASEACFGGGVRFEIDYGLADVILAIDSDFLNPAETLDTGGFFRRREPGSQPMNRLYVIENHFTLTGGMADHRLRSKVSHMGGLVLALAQHISDQTNSGELNAILSSFPAEGPARTEPWIKACANDLLRSPGRSLILTGPQTPAPIQVLVHGINRALGNHGATITGLSDPMPRPASISALCSAMARGTIQTLLILEGNPAYNAPADLNFPALLAGVPDVVRLGLFEDETSKLSKWHVPAAHFLESWGDARTLDGTYSSIQPMILPLWGGLSDLALLGRLLGIANPDGPAMVRATFEGLTNSPDGSDGLWSEFLRCGFLPTSNFQKVPLAFRQEPAAALAAQYSSPTDGLELVFLRSNSVDDGRFANNAWLQETPDFATKLVWDNAALLSPVTAQRLGIRTGDSEHADIVEISHGGRIIEVAALVAPGHADDSISMALGYGRKGVSSLLEGVGFDAYPLRRNGNPRSLGGVTVRLTGRSYEFALTQEHHSMQGRDLVRQGTLERFQREPQFAKSMGGNTPGHPREPLNQSPPPASQEQWGMAIDLNICTGCNACAVACQAENNVPVVGKVQVRNTRDMAWIRIDRYFSGNANEPEMLPQPVMCQHCEKAPCEPVCPVNATVHSEDGLNLMTYNRCIGTRYCASNCPWKVRRFNFFDYNERPLDELYWGPLASKGMAESLKMAKNPNVTVRMRGVMEKCTFCIQRIEEAQITRLIEAGPTPASKTPLPIFQSACQQACPSRAIVFGNIADPSSPAARQRNSPRGYTLFDHLGAGPRVTYLARLRNPNPEMPDAELADASGAAIPESKPPERDQPS